MARHVLWPLVILPGLSIRFLKCRQCKMGRKLLLEGGRGCTWLACTESKAEAPEDRQALWFVTHCPASVFFGLNFCAVCVLHFAVFSFTPHAMQATPLSAGHLFVWSAILGAGIVQGHAQRLALVCLLYLSVYTVL